MRDLNLPEWLIEIDSGNLRWSINTEAGRPLQFISQTERTFCLPKAKFIGFSKFIFIHMQNFGGAPFVSRFFF